jgi:hypothetical protein
MNARATPTQASEEQFDPANPEQEIRRRAFELYEERDRVDGHALDDWLRAETEVFSRFIRKTVA